VGALLFPEFNYLVAAKVYYANTLTTLDAFGKININVIAHDR